MRIGDAAAAAGTTPRALRFYEQRGLLPPAPRTMTGQREYGPRDVALVRIIRELLSLGLTVEDVAAAPNASTFWRAKRCRRTEVLAAPEQRESSSAGSPPWTRRSPA